MHGYTGWFSKTFTGDGLAAGNYDLVSVVNVAEVGALVYANDFSGVDRDAAQFVWQIEVLRNTGAATIKPGWTDSASGINVPAKYGGGLTDALPFGNMRLYVENYDDAVSASTYVALGARLAVTTAGNFSYRLTVRPYHMSGWQRANLTGAAALTYVDPSITNTALGRVSTYANEIAQAKDFIYSRIVAAGIDPNEIPTDGVATITTLVSAGNPQQIATYLIPELCDAATYLTLSLIHERYTQQPDDIHAYKREMYKDRYEIAMSEALKNLPLNLNDDYQLSEDEERIGQPSVLVR